MPIFASTNNAPGRFPETEKQRIMNTTFAQDIAKIANALNGKVEFSHIEFDQVLLGEEYREQSVNDIVFVKKAYGVYFYIRRSEMEAMVMLKRPKEMTVLVGCDGSNRLYRISDTMAW